MKKLLFRKLHSGARLPTRGTAQSSGLDLYSVENYTLEKGERVAVRTGLSLAIPRGYYGRVAPRSGLALTMGIDTLAGVVDADFRGELMCILVNHGDDICHVAVGDRIAQLLIEKIAMLEPVWHEFHDETDRNDSAFGSTGR
jgi:deoxyuridine 5'-triphosphate nucleotidohydrolase